VVRLPRDWLGPREELVPIGRPASVGAAVTSGDDSLPPTAEAFWSEDSAALHDAVQGPTSVSTASPAAPALPAGRGLLHPRIRWPHRPAGQARWLLVALPVLALLVLAVIGGTETTGARRAGHAPALTQSGSAAKLAAAGTEDGSRSAAPSHPKASSARQRHRSRSGLARRRVHRTRPRPPRHPSARPHTSGSTPPTDVSTPAAGSTGSSSTGSPAVTGVSSTSRSGNESATSTGHTPFGEKGTLGPGSSPDS
jgi:hypothetical protein